MITDRKNTGLGRHIGSIYVSGPAFERINALKTVVYTYKDVYIRDGKVLVGSDEHKHYRKQRVRAGLEGHDICSYCGADNGPNGEYRQGWDCVWCGGN